ncbi:MAG: LysR substrate-binding domain-containing protein [Pseudomonadota bacterium]
MSTPRRYLPSTALLAAFEAVCRTGSAAEAARHLSLTQGTVSRLIQSLEEHLGVALFRRDRRRLTPTEAARAYAAEVRPALDQIARATMTLLSGGGAGALNLAILPGFGTHWLAPRLPAFLAAHPGVTVNLATRLRPFDFAAEGFDAAIHYGRADWPGAGHLRLMEERVIPVAAASLAATLRPGLPDSLPDSLLAAPLLQIESRPNAWRGWFRARGVEATVPRGMVFDQFATMAQAAIAGLGVALLPEFVVGPILAEGRLAALGEAGAVSGAAYWLVWPEARAEHPPVAAFREWVRGQVAT